MGSYLLNSGLLFKSAKAMAPGELQVQAGHRERNGQLDTVKTASAIQLGEGFLHFLQRPYGPVGRSCLPTLDLPCRTPQRQIWSLTVESRSAVVVRDRTGPEELPRRLRRLADDAVGRRGRALPYGSR
jgi:hypothetical protein